MKTAFLLLNFGTPKAPTRKAVRSYLTEVLSDLSFRFLPKLLQQILIRWIIIPWRLNETVKRYKSSWTEEGSLLFVYSKRLCDKLSKNLSCPTALAMKYGSPSIAPTHEPLIVFSLFPIKTKFESAFEGPPEHTLIADYYVEPWFIEPSAQLLSQAKPSEYDHTLFSFHALPLSYEGVDEYVQKCHQMAGAIAKAANVKEYSVCFQSKMGFGKWTEPEISNHLAKLAAGGKKRVLLMMPGFIVDCLETVGDFTKYRFDFISSGGEELGFVGALNDFEPWVNQLTQYVRKLL